MATMSFRNNKASLPVCSTCSASHMEISERCQVMKREVAPASFLETCSSHDLQILRCVPRVLWERGSLTLDGCAICSAIPSDKLFEIPNLAAMCCESPGSPTVNSDYSSDEGSESDASESSHASHNHLEPAHFEWERVKSTEWERVKHQPAEAEGHYFTNLKDGRTQWDRPLGRIGKAGKCICCAGKALESDGGVVPGDWDLGEMGMLELPDDFANTKLRVKGSLLLDQNQLKELPSGDWNICVDGHLFLNDNALQSLPEAFGNVKIKGDLYLQNNKLQHVPSCLSRIQVGGDIHCIGNEMAVPSSFPNVAGKVYNSKRIKRGKAYDCWKKPKRNDMNSPEHHLPNRVAPANNANKESFQQVLDDEFGDCSVEALLLQFKREDEAALKRHHR